MCHAFFVDNSWLQRLFIRSDLWTTPPTLEGEAVEQRLRLQKPVKTQRKKHSYVHRRKLSKSFSSLHAFSAHRTMILFRFMNIMVDPCCKQSLFNGELLVEFYSFLTTTRMHPVRLTKYFSFSSIFPVLYCIWTCKQIPSKEQNCERCHAQSLISSEPPCMVHNNAFFFFNLWQVPETSLILFFLLQKRLKKIRKVFRIERLHNSAYSKSRMPFWWFVNK